MPKRRKKHPPQRRPAAGRVFGARTDVADATAAAAVALVTARRDLPIDGDHNDEKFGDLVGTTIGDLMDAYPDRQFEAVGYLVAQLATQAAAACDRWDDAAGGAPSATLLTTIGLHAATQRRE